MNLFYELLTTFGIIYAITYTLSKLLFAYLSFRQIDKYTKKYNHIATEEEVREYTRAAYHDPNRILPKVSIISPAFNEGVMIKDTVDTYIHQSYPNTEVIICSDSGTDGTLESMMEYYELYEIDGSEFKHSPKIKHKPIKRYFRSKKYDKLIVIDKENGGKGDSQNAGISISTGEISTIIDADSMLEKNALYHLVSIFERESTTIGVGTPIGVLNDSTIGDDGIEEGTVPKSFWGKVQVLEYLRSFLLGRMSLQNYRGLAMVSGAFGVYYKWVIEEVGGYESGSLAEDMDIDCKIWRMLDDKDYPFKIRYIPEVFCWSEVPNDFKNLLSQRDRWSRGLTTTMYKNKDLFFNPKYGMLGVFAYPYYLFYEWLTPFIEIAGLIALIITVCLGVISYSTLGIIFLIYWFLGFSLNIATLRAEKLTHGHYKDNKPLNKLIGVALVEPVFYHWINSAFYVWGNIRLIFGAKGWGAMTRQGIKRK